MESNDIVPFAFFFISATDTAAIVIIQRERESLDAVFLLGEEENTRTKTKVDDRQYDLVSSSSISTLLCWRLTREERDRDRETSERLAGRQ